MAKSPRKIPHIEVSYDTLENIPYAARASGVDDGKIAIGLLRMWQHLWRRKNAEVTSLQLLGYFGADVAEALCAFGELERLGTDSFRVRQTERELRKHAGRSAGGEAAKGNLKRGTKPGSGRGRVVAAPAQSRLESRLAPGSFPAPATSHQPSAISHQPPPESSAAVDAAPGEVVEEEDPDLEPPEPHWSPNEFLAFWQARRAALGIARDREPAQALRRTLEAILERYLPSELEPAVNAYLACADPNARWRDHFPLAVLLRPGVLEPRLGESRARRRVCCLCREPRECESPTKQPLCNAHWREWWESFEREFPAPVLDIVELRGLNEEERAERREEQRRLDLARDDERASHFAAWLAAERERTTDRRCTQMHAPAIG